LPETGSENAPMQWIADNWLLIALIVAMIVMHLGHGKHGGGGKT